VISLNDLTVQSSEIERGESQLTNIRI
jgi:hypothetical protein